MDLAAAYAAHVAHLGTAYGHAITAAGFDALVIASGRPTEKNRFDDAHWPLSPTPAFRHWLPLIEADAYLVIRPGARPRLIRTVVDDFWEAPATPDSDHFWSAFDLTLARAADIRHQLPSGKVAYVSRDGDAAVGELNPPALIAALDRVRTRKTEYELGCLAAASARAVVGHRRAAQEFAAGDPSELQLHLGYLAATDQDDADAPYKGIVAIGDHAAILHWVSYHRTASGRPDTSLLVDAGARHLGYGSDITRTHVRGHSAPAHRFRELIARMDRLQQDVCARIAVGMEYEALHDHSHELLADALIEVGLGLGAAEALIARGVTRALFPHGLGHSLGIITHDVGMKPRAPRADNPFLRNTSIIEAGQVFTIEPGCYFIPALLAPLRTDDRNALVDWRLVDELAPFGGIRIEDNVVVTATGVTNLTRDAFARLAAA
jgi:Xaa-Pro dipeptidase